MFSNKRKSGKCLSPLSRIRNLFANIFRELSPHTLMLITNISMETRQSRFTKESIEHKNVNFPHLASFFSCSVRDYKEAPLCELVETKLLFHSTDVL